MVKAVALQVPYLSLGTGYRAGSMNSSAHNWLVDSLHDPNAGRCVHDVAVGRGRSPGIPRWSPHFRVGPVAVVGAFWEEDDDDARRKPDAARIDGVLVPDEVLQRLDGDGWRSAVLMQTQKVRYHQDPQSVVLASARSPQANRNILGCRLLRLVSLLARRCQRNLLRPSRMTLATSVQKWRDQL